MNKEESCKEHFIEAEGIEFEGEKYTIDVLERMLDTCIELKHIQEHREKAEKLIELFNKNGYKTIAKEYKAKLN